MRNMSTIVGLIVVAVLALALYNMTYAAQSPSAPPLSLVQKGDTGNISSHVARPSSFPRTTSSIVGPPTITADFIDRVLRDAHSPAVGIGNAMYRLGMQYGIDPAFPLAFFHHESTYGKAGWAVTNHSIGNIRCTAGYACNGGYRFYSTWEAGVADWYLLISTVYLPQGLNTIEKIIPVYAPSADNNNEAAYIGSVLSDMAAFRRGEVYA